MKSCGGCIHFKSKRCMNKRASTYGQIFSSNSYACQLSISNIALPFIALTKGAFLIIYPIVILISFLLNRGSDTSSRNSGKNGFTI